MSGMMTMRIVPLSDKKAVQCEGDAEHISYKNDLFRTTPLLAQVKPQQHLLFLSTQGRAPFDGATNCTLNCLNIYNLFFIDREQRV